MRPWLESATSITSSSAWEPAVRCSGRARTAMSGRVSERGSSTIGRCIWVTASSPILDSTSWWIRTTQSAWAGVIGARTTGSPSRSSRSIPPPAASLIVCHSETVMPCPSDISAQSVGDLAELLHEALELLEVAALVGPVAMGGVLADNGVAGVPVGTGLGVQPVDVPGLLGHLAQHPGLGRVVVVAGVTEQQDGRLGVDLAPPALPERLEGMSVVGVPVHPDHIRLGVDPVDVVRDDLGCLEVVGDLVDPVDEHVGSDPAELED